MLVSYRAPQHYAACFNTTLLDGRIVQDKLVLKPGVNEVDPEKWDKVKDHPQVRRRINQGLIEVISQGDESTHASELRALRPNEARRLVRETIDVDVLLKWQEIEDRDTVLDQIHKQLGKVSKTVDEAENDLKTKRKRAPRKKKPRPIERAEPEDEDED